MALSGRRRLFKRTPGAGTERVPPPPVYAAVLALLLAWSCGLPAQSAPQPPCGRPPQPYYAQIGEQPTVQVWGRNKLASWIPPACTGWTDGAGNLLVALAGTFRYAGSAEVLLNRYGAVSTLRGIRYWSVTDKTWRVLVTEAAGLGSSNPDDRRPDFAAPEIKVGRDRYFVQQDSRSSGDVVYRMRVREAGADRLVLEMENVTPVRVFFVTVFRPGGMKFLYFLDRLAGDTWSIYALLSADNSYAEANAASFINRAAAFYRHFTGVPTDGAPPLAR